MQSHNLYHSACCRGLAVAAADLHTRLPIQAEMAGKGPRRFSKDGLERTASPGPPLLPGLVRPSPTTLGPDLSPTVVGRPHGLQTPPMGTEQKLASQQAEIQRLLTENQRLAITHVALRQELAAAQQEAQRVHRSTAVDTEKEQRMGFTQVALRQELADAQQEVEKLQEAIIAIRTEKDHHIRAALERTAQMEAELRVTHSLRGDFEKIRYEKEELAARIEQLMGEAKKIPLKDQEIAVLKTEVDELRRKYQQARMDFEHQKKVSFERQEQNQAMEKNSFTMGREIEKLRMESTNVERRAHGASLASSGVSVPQLMHGGLPPTGAYEKNYGSQEALKNGHSVGRPEKKAIVETGKHGPGAEDFQSGMQVSEDRMTKQQSSPLAEWSKHDGPNGKSFYYNAATGAAQWDKPLAGAAAETHTPHQRQLQQVQGQDGLTSSHQPQQQLSSPRQPTPPTTKHQGAQHGINLVIFGISDGISDHDLASLFRPYGSVLHAKVVVDNATGQCKGYGVVLMENPQAAEAAVAAVNGMFILGRRIKVEVQQTEQGLQHQGYSQPLMQKSMMPGGVGPVRWNHRGGATGQWPY